MILFLLLFSSLSIGLINFYIGYKRIKNGSNIPKSLTDLPVHITSEAAYIASKTKVEGFSGLTLNNQKAKLVLNEDDLNNLFCKGVTLDKFRPGSYFYYEICSNYIIEKRIIWPFTVSLNPISYKETWIYFENTVNTSASLNFEDMTGIPAVNFRVVKEDNRELNIISENFPITYLSLFIFIFDFGLFGAMRYFANPKSIEY